MLAVLFKPEFVQPILTGLKTETRRLPCCRRCQAHAMELLPQVFEDAPRMRCLACGIHANPRWRVTPQKQFAAVTRPLFAIPPECPDDPGDRSHGRMQRLRDKADNDAVTGYWCETCGSHQSARFALLECIDRRLEQLDSITEEAARADGLCSREAFVPLVLSLNDAQRYRKYGEKEWRSTPHSVAVEVYRFRLLGP